MSAAFRLDDFLLEDTLLAPKVHLPGSLVFRVHPRHCARVRLVWHRGAWWLIAAKAIPPDWDDDDARFRKIFTAEIYLAVDDTRTPFILPVTFEHPSWYQSLLEAVETARTDWTRVSKDEQRYCFTHRALTRSVEPDWPEQPFAELVAAAFAGHVITTRKALTQLLTPKPHSVVEEGDD